MHPRVPRSPGDPAHRRGRFPACDRPGDRVRREGARRAGRGPVGERNRRSDASTWSLVRAISPRADAGAVAGLGRLLRRWRPDVVHAHSSKAGAVARMARAARPGTPLLYTPHGYAFNGWFESEGERTPLPGGRAGAGAPDDDRRSASARPSAGWPSPSGSRRTEVVYNGVPAARAGAAASRLAELRERGPVVGVLSLLRPGKGLETLIDAAPALLAEHPGASIAIAGEGPDRAALEQRARELGVRGRRGLPRPRRGPGPAARRDRRVREPVVGGVVPALDARGDAGRAARRDHRRRRRRRGDRRRRERRARPAEGRSRAGGRARRACCRTPNGARAMGDAGAAAGAGAVRSVANDRRDTCRLRACPVTNIRRRA